MLTCPEPEQLASFDTGLISEDFSSEIGRHVDQCPRCRQVLESLEQGRDPLCAALLRRPDPDQNQPSVALQRVLNRCGSGTLAVSPRENVVPEPALIGTTIGPYRLQEVIGQGGMGVVYKARHESLDRVVALKLLPASRACDPEIVSRFRREMLAVGQLNHPNIVAATDAGEIDGQLFLAMEFLEGEDLGRVLKQGGPLRIADAVECIRQAATGLQVVHDAGIVHRDVKPGNLLLTRECQVKVLDLGLARLSDWHSEGPRELTQSALLMGTLEYLAPEQGLDGHVVDGRADIYSLGATLFKLLTGQTPFPVERYDTPLKQLRAIATQDVPSILERRTVPKPLAAIVDRMLCRDPRERFDSLQEIVDAIAPFAVGADLARLLDAPKTARADETVADGASLTTLGPGERDVRDAAHVQHDAHSQQERSPERFAVIPRPAANCAPPAKRVWLRARLAAVVAGVLLLAGVVLFLPTQDGMVRIEISDPSVEVTVSGDERYRVTGPDGEFEIGSGRHSLHITVGGTTFQTREFTLDRDERLALRVMLLDGRKVQVIDGETVFDEHTLPPAAEPAGSDFQRDLAEELLERGALVRVNVDGQIHNLNRPLMAVPAGDEVVLILVAKGREAKLDSEMVARLARCSFLESLDLTHCPVTDEDVRRLAGLRLQTLTISATQITDKCVPSLLRMKSLTRLYVSHTRLSDDGLMQLAALTGLEELRVGHPGLTSPATIEALARALPGCLVASPFNDAIETNGRNAEDGPAPPPLPQAVERSAQAFAEWFKGKDGEQRAINVVLTDTDQQQRVTRLADFPDQPCRIVLLEFDWGARCDDATLREIARRCPPELEGFSVLHKFGPPFTLDGFRTLVEAFPGLKQLRLNFILQEADTWLPVVQELDQLEWIQIPHTNDSVEADKWAVGLSQMPSLREVRFYAANLTPAGLELLASLPDLECVSVLSQDTGNEDALLRAAVCLQQIQRLELPLTEELTRDGILALAALQNLDELSVTSHKLGVDPAIYRQHFLDLKSRLLHCRITWGTGSSRTVLRAEPQSN